MADRKIIPGDTLVKIKPKRKKPLKRGASLPSTFVRRPMSQKYIDSRLKAEKAMQLKLSGFTWARICEEVGYAHESSAAMAVKRLLQRTARLDVEEWIQLHVERTESMMRRLERGMIQGNPRSVEVAVKVLERQAELLGLDYEDRKDTSSKQPNIEINILADPRDADAKRFLDQIVSGTGPAVLDGAPVRRALPSPAEGDLQP